ncbi:MAG: arsenite efflux transporter metallochaperone ArsD [Bacteroidota bacterium]
MENTKQQNQTATLTVYDPAMCCSTGVCGPDVDDKLVDFANDVKWLKSQGFTVQRHNLGQEPEAFKSNPEVIARLQNEGSDILPILTIDGSIISEGDYPNRDQLTDWLGIKAGDEAATSDEKQEILSLLRKSVVEGNIGQIRNQFQLGENTGISKEELVGIIQAGVNERQQTTKKAVDAANELLGISTNGCAPGSGCC